MIAMRAGAAAVAIALALAVSTAQAQPGPPADRGNQGLGQGRGAGQSEGRGQGEGRGQSVENGDGARNARPASEPARASQNRPDNPRANPDVLPRRMVNPVAQDDHTSRPAQRPLAGEMRQAPSRYLRSGRTSAASRHLGLIAGCPPGLARQGTGCQPPGLARADGYYRRPDYDLGWWGLPRHDDRRYRYASGYLVRLGPDGRVSGYIPLLGGALAIGSLWPDGYGEARLSPYYARFYGLGTSYRYADNVVYRLDPQTAAISSIAALLTGDDFVIGQPMPRGYDIYNVPYAYRDRYHDGPEALYRYSDGYIYEVDPETRLIAAAIELLAS